ncbi:antigen WC1.1 isoform X1 [Alligator mississippiensis]|uniref:antigen WC1.1 isoform X1 n=1 Tax=Alligator mississippiensis TaxID=8496 RepID=UPI00287756FB|nr:antigen WC1.1 isoform X1 [Alligator mississippiensis]
MGDGPVWNGTFGCERDESHRRDCFVTALGAAECPHRSAARVVCSGCPRGRLVNGTECSGRVEIQYGVTWGALCGSQWDLQAAHVLCRQLKCGYAKSIPRGAQFGEVYGVVWRDIFYCEGTESCLWNCSHIVLGNPSCSSRETASVICSGPWEGTRSLQVLDSPTQRSPSSPHFSFPGDFASLRLLNGENQCDGRVEIFLDGVWVRVLDDEWNMNDANVVCRQLQCGIAEKAYNPSKSERGTGPVWLRSIHCSGYESRLTLCNTSVSETAQAGIAEDVGVICSGSRRIRLVNGAGRCAGRVEIYYRGTWGTVCDDSWDLLDSNVVCKQLRCGYAIKAAASTLYGEGSGKIWLDDVNCSGNESKLWECPSRGWGQHDCRHKEDVGVLCSDFVSLRLVNGGGCAGRLEVFYNGTWGSVCSNQMTQVTATIVCKQLSCGDEGEIATDFAYGQGSGLTWLDRIECHEHHSSLWQCPSEPWDPKSCDNRAEETHITCTGRKENSTQAPFSKCPNSTSCTDKEKLRVVGTEDRCSGRVEVWHRGSWGTVCDNSWDMADANVVCKQLGCGAAVSALGEAAYGEGTGPIWLDKLNCKGTESSLWDCCAEPWDDSKCHHKDDAAVICTGVTEMPTPPVKTGPSNHQPPTAGRGNMVPIVICIVLGALLCLVLIILGGQLQSSRALSRGSKGPLDPFSEAVYEEIDYNLREKQEMFGYSEDSLMKLYYYTGDSEEGNEPGSAQEASAFPGDSYDDAREVSDPENDSVSAQSDQKVSGLAKNSCKKRGSRTGWSLLSLKSEGASGAEKNDSSLPPGDVGYDNVEDNITATSL